MAGALLAVLCGLILLTPLGAPWQHASYDVLFRFATRPTSNDVVLVLMDQSAHEALEQVRGEPWDRGLHAGLLDRLTQDDCPLVVFDVRFTSPEARNTEATRALADAIRAHGNVVLMASSAELHIPQLVGEQPKLPDALFLEAGADWGFGYVGAPWLDIPRRHWPYASPEHEPSLPQVAAQKSGTDLSNLPNKRWLRYYGTNGPGPVWSYHLVTNLHEGYFSNKVVFVGSAPEFPQEPDVKEPDKFKTPYTAWTGHAVGGVEILATEFLNLVQGDWLRRLHWILEVGLLIVAGSIAGLTFGRLGPWVGGFLLAAGFALTLITAVLLYHHLNIWFPWLVVAGGQLPIAWASSLIPIKQASPAPSHEEADTVVLDTTPRDIPYTPDYQRVRKLGEGGFGEVWLVRNAIGQWQALKVVYRRNFDEERHYNFEFEGIQKYKPVSEKYPGLLRVELISQKRDEGYYYYVMELGDSIIPGWEEDTSLYQADTLTSRLQLSASRRLKIRDCIRYGLTLADALHCLHQNGLTHRDVKPPNIVFVGGQPKLADLGLVTHARAADNDNTQVGTPGFMPPEPEPKGTVQADIYSLGMVLYCISTGRVPSLFPELSKTLIENSSSPDLMRLNPVILKACHPDTSQRYQTAAELRDALAEVQESLL